jgi:hypothetical protein
MTDDELTPVSIPRVGDPRDWETLRADAIQAVRDVTGDGELAEQVTDIVLAIFDQEALSRLGAHLVQETRLKSMDFRNGAVMDIIPAREAVAGWVGAARAMLGDAPNYTETVMEFSIPEDPQRYAFTVQKVGKLTPHQARLRAETERDRALADLGQAREDLERVRGLLEEWRQLAGKENPDGL